MFAPLNHVQVSTATSQNKDTLNEPWPFGLEIFSVGSFFSFLWLWSITSRLILGSAHAVKITPQNLVPLFSLGLCHNHLVLTSCEHTLWMANGS